MIYQNKIILGRWRETIVAVKILKTDGMTENNVRDFLCNIIIYFVYFKKI